MLLKAGSPGPCQTCWRISFTEISLTHAQCEGTCQTAARSRQSSSITPPVHAPQPLAAPLGFLTRDQSSFARDSHTEDRMGSAQGPCLAAVQPLMAGRSPVCPLTCSPADGSRCAASGPALSPASLCADTGLHSGIYLTSASPWSIS